jgi:hypothetical protein
MRKSLWIILSVLVVAFGSPIAHADSFVASFECHLRCGFLPVSQNLVSFPDPVLEIFIAPGASPRFEVVLPSSDFPSNAYTWIDNISVSSDGRTTRGSINVFDHSTGSDSVGRWRSFHSPFLLFPGDYSDMGRLQFSPVFSAVAAPEPSSVGLMLLGIGLVFAVRKRGLSQAS